MITLHDTPIEPYLCRGIPVAVKREDLCADPPLPPLAKLRGIQAYMQRVKQEGATAVGVLDTRVSKSGLGVACIASDLGLTCHYYFPVRKDETDWLTPTRAEASRQGAVLVPMQAGRIGIVYARAKKREAGTMLPLGFPLYETVLETANVMAQVDPAYYQGGTIVVSVGQGAIVAGLMVGLARVSRGRDTGPAMLRGITASMDPGRAWRRITKHLARASLQEPGPYVKAGLWWAAAYTKLIKEGEVYYEPAEEQPPFPAHPYYEGKAWAWLKRNIGELPLPILFWNVGS